MVCLVIYIMNLTNHSNNPKGLGNKFDPRTNTDSI